METQSVADLIFKTGIFFTIIVICHGVYLQDTETERKSPSYIYDESNPDYAPPLEDTEIKNENNRRQVELEAKPIENETPNENTKKEGRRYNEDPNVLRLSIQINHKNNLAKNNGNPFDTESKMRTLNEATDQSNAHLEFNIANNGGKADTEPKIRTFKEDDQSNANTELDERNHGITPAKDLLSYIRERMDEDPQTPNPEVYYNQVDNNAVTMPQEYESMDIKARAQEDPEIYSDNYGFSSESPVKSGPEYNNDFSTEAPVKSGFGHNDFNTESPVAKLNDIKDSIQKVIDSLGQSQS